MNHVITEQDQAATVDWVARAFTPAALSLEERRDRIAEEFAELCQACEMQEDRVHIIVKEVYRRPKGEIGQEIGGCALTLIALAGSLRLNFVELFRTELNRVLHKPMAMFRKRQAEKADLGLSIKVDYDAL